MRFLNFAKKMCDVKKLLNNQHDTLDDLPINATVAHTLDDLPVNAEAANTLDNSIVNAAAARTLDDLPVNATVANTLDDLTTLWMAGQLQKNTLSII